CGDSGGGGMNRRRFLNRPSPAASRHPLPASGARDVDAAILSASVATDVDDVLLPGNGEKVAEGRMRGVDRRQFAKLLGGGIVVLITAKPMDLFGQQRRGYPEDPNAYLRI